MTEEEFLKRKEAADTHDEEAAEVNIDFFPSSNPKLYIPSTLNINPYTVAHTIDIVCSKMLKIMV